eukprot:tig00000692_g3266.t1
MAGKDGDVEHRKQVMELQGRFMETQRQLVGITAQIQMRDREKKKTGLTLKEIDELPKGVNTYKSIGKMFLLTPTEMLAAELKSRIGDAEKDIQSFSNSRAYLERQLREVETQLREITRS